MKYQYRQQKSNYKLSFAILFIGIILGVAISYYYFSYQIQPTQAPTTNYNFVPSTPYRVQMNLVAVDDAGKGVTTPLIIEAKPGDGKALTNVEKLLFWVDTQYSIQIAKNVAQNVTNIDTSKWDLTYSIETNASVIGGPSAGAALTIATIAALENKQLKNDIMMTGTINEDGSIGEVGGVLEKAKAAKDVGAKVFLVPKGQGEQTTFQPIENCVRKAGFIFCETTYKAVTINIGKDAGISVIEVGNVTDAMKYFGL
jgi:uncharacterized protein